MESEIQIIDAAAEGDTVAFERIVERYSRPIYRYVRNVVGDGHAAEDVVQRVFINVYRSLNQFDSNRGRFSTWIYRIARNSALNHLRDNKPLRIEFTTPLGQESPEPSPQAQAELREQYALLDQAVAELPEHQRSAWVLAELEGLTQAEIARIEGIPEGTVKSRVSRARETLRKTLADRIGLER